MVYIEYEKYKTKYYESQSNFNDILDEQEKLFAKTQPKATIYDKEKVKGGKPVNTFESYVIVKQKKKIDERLKEAKSILEDRAILLKAKEEELKASKNWYDVIYTYYYIENYSERKIENKIPYSKSQIHRILEKIKKNIQ